MHHASLDELAEALLYEGFILYPYRPALKNTQRWTFGGLYPRQFCDAQQSIESMRMQTQCLVLGNGNSSVTIDLRFLQIIDRKIGRFATPCHTWPPEREPEAEPVQSWAVGGRLFQSWQEAIERRVELSGCNLGELVQAPQKWSFELPGHREREPIVDEDGRYVGVVQRTQQALKGAIELLADQVADACFRLTVRAENETDLHGPATLSREEASLYSFAAAHTVLTVCGGELVSQIDPPDAWRDAVAANENVGVWPVLVGEAHERTTMLAAPIILDDYPQIAPESHTGLFDSTEIDEMLTLRIQTLTEAEKTAMRSVDPRCRQLLEHVEAIGSQELLQLHGAIRDVKRNPFCFDEGRNEFRCTKDPFGPLPEQVVQSVLAHGVLLVAGDRVRLSPRATADIFDLVLAGKTAIIHSIEHDLEGQIHLAVTIDDDPGRDLGEQLQPGHRFFFKLDEVEPIAESSGKNR